MTKTYAIIFTAFLVSALLGSSFAPGGSETAPSAVPATEPARELPPPVPVGNPTFVSPQAAPMAISHGYLYVVNTPSDTIDVINTVTREVEIRVPVGVDPVGIAVRPDEKEVWISNHISDSVSVLDSDPRSPTFLQVVATVQEFDMETKATRFDEPVGIAFASNEKAYVALSSENQIAVVDVATRAITKRLTITAQDPRAIAVRGNRLYVIPFESNNQTQLSGGTGEIDGDLVTFDAHEHSIAHNNVLSLGHVVDIVKHPKVPDRDLYIFDTETDKLVEVVDTLGTLLYGLTVDSKGSVFVTQTDARNEINGRSGTKKHGLAELQNRAFLNRITRVTFKEGAADQPEFIELEQLPPKHPEKNQALATPFAIKISKDDSTLVVSAAGSDKLFTVDAGSGEILGRASVGAVPRGIALEHDPENKPWQAWVLNAVANTVSIVDVSDASNLQIVDTISLADPTHPSIKRGRIAFNTASASTTGTFSCASCHPDGHTDQLLWVLQTPIVTGGDQIMPRSTMPIRGLRDTAPYHWDGIPGDPYGGNNSANIHGSDPPNSNLSEPTSTTRHLIDGGLATTMSMVGDASTNDEGKAGALSAAERDDMAAFLLSVPYPPAPQRAYTNIVSDVATQGFKLFHIDGDRDDDPRPNVCGNCHRMPFLVSTNTRGSGMDAPTWRGAYDRFLILPQGRLNIIDFSFYRRIAARGLPERRIWQLSWGGRRRFNPVWNMVLEGSTGFSGSFARQVTLSKSSVEETLVPDLLTALEISASEGAIILEGDGVLIEDSKPHPVALQFHATFHGGSYIEKTGNRKMFRRDDLLTLASQGKFVGTFSARHGAKADFDHPQPAIWTLGPLEKQRGRQDFPILHRNQRLMTVSGRHIDTDAQVIVDGRRVPATVSCDENEMVEITLSNLPSVGMHLLQVQNSAGRFSNDFIFHVAEDAAAAAELKRSIDRQHVDWRRALARAISAGDLQETKNLRRRGVPINERRPRGSSIPLSIAARHGEMEIIKYLLKHRANVQGTNRDGSTPLHVAAYFCRVDIVKLFLENGGSLSTKNREGETPIDLVSAPWSEEVATAYRRIGRAVNLELDLERLERMRPQIVQLLKTHADANSGSSGEGQDR